MKLKLKLFYYDWNAFNERKIEAETVGYDSDCKVRLKTVTVEIPDDIDLSESQYKEAVYFHKLSAAEKAVQQKRTELHIAEEIVKNMLAIEHKPNE